LTRRFAGLRARAVALAICVTAGCVHVTPPARLPGATGTPPGDYWDLVERLDLDRAALAAQAGHSHDEEALAAALKQVMAGEAPRAIVSLDSLARRTYTDSTVRRVAVVVLAGLLHTEHRWSELSALPVVPGIKRDSADLAGVEAWAAAFEGVRAPRARFRSDSAIFPIVLSPIGVPMLPVEINGKRFLFWLDTGASMTMISPDVARAVGIAPRTTDSLEAVTAVGRVRVLPALVGSLHVGPLDWNDAPAMIVGGGDFSVADTAAAGRTARAKIDGIIGWDVLRQLDVRVDHPRGTLTMRRPAREHLAASRRNLFWIGYPLVRAQSANGATLNLGLDTGLQATFVTRSLVSRSGGTVLGVERRRLASIAGDSIVRGEVLQEVRLRVGDSEILLRGVTVQAAVSAGFVALDGVIGSDVGFTGVVRIDATNGVFSVKP
jgi:hypothetical protein